MSRTRSAALRLMLLSAVAMVLIVSPAAAEPDTSRLDRLERELRDIEQGIEQREEDVAELDAQAGELRDQEADARARLEEIEAELSLAVERYNEAVVALEEVQAERAEIVAELEAVSAEVAALERSVAEHARRLHKLGPTVEFTTYLGSEDPADLGFKGASLQRILGNEQAGLEELVAARVRLDALETRLAEQEAAADAAAAAVEEQVREVEATHARHEEELSELTAFLDEVERNRAAEQDRLSRDRERLSEQEQAVEDERAAVEAERRRIEEERRREQERREQERREQERREQERREQERREQQRREQEAAAASTTSSGGGGSSSGGSSSGGSSSGGSASSGGSSGSGGSSSGPRRSAQVAVDTALAQVGKPYRWGATGPDAYDCSGLTSYAWRAAGVTIPRTSGAQYSQLRKVSRSELQPGDLVFYHSPISHVAMYVGNGTIVEAPRSGLNVRTAALANRSPVGYARP